MKIEMSGTIQEFLLSKVNPSFIIVFGSYAKNTAHEKSDIDIAYYSKKTSNSPYEIFLLSQELANILKINVDLIDLSKASTVFQAQIYSTGTIIYCQDDLFLKKQQMVAFSMYAKLNEERGEILR